MQKIPSLARKKACHMLKIFLDLQIILWKMRRVLTNFWDLIWTNMYYESLWNHFVIKQGVFSSLKITCYVAIAIKVYEVSDFRDSHFLEKLLKQFANCQNSSQIANCKRLIQTLPLVIFVKRFLLNGNMLFYMIK